MKQVVKSIKKLSRYAEESEKSIETYLVRKVKSAGGLCLKFTSHVETGYPDRLLLMPGGRLAWVEVKSKGRKPRALQSLRMGELSRLGFSVRVADSKAKVDAILEGLATAEPSLTEKEQR